jgi:hypothetical protein
VTPGPFAELPLIPDGDEARRWAQEELSDPAYAAAEPTPFDRAARAVSDFIGMLFGGGVSGSWAASLAIVALLVVTALIVVAILIWGRPRGIGRARRDPAVLFGETETRTAAQLREAAARHADRGEWELAVVVRFRALARGLDERVLVAAEPGMTARRFARAAGRVFPDAFIDLRTAADAFDQVRYLRAPATAEHYRIVVRADDAVVAARPREAVA